ncbi:hypothetical protein VTP01DRAFT_6125 [Rhizomucor pusillus]|uniref:uncharacterized protein n=1 Tax=Rhizomucor pusillus TaxID=4840 RepID=UPI0037447236
MFRSTLFTFAISALAAMALAAPKTVQKRHDDDNSGVIDLQDVGLVNVDEALKNAEVLNDVNLLSKEHNDDHYRHHDHHGYHDYDGHYDIYDDHGHYFGDFDGDADEYI